VQEQQQQQHQQQQQPQQEQQLQEECERQHQQQQQQQQQQPQPERQQQEEREEQQQQQEIEYEQQQVPQESLGGMSMRAYVESKQAGRDGSHCTPRVRPEAYVHLKNLTCEQRCNLGEHLMGVIFDEYITSNWSQESVTRLMQRSKGRYSHLPPWLKDCLPNTFKQLLVALRALGYDVHNNTYDYPCCPCGFLYRCEEAVLLDGDADGVAE